MNQRIQPVLATIPQDIVSTFDYKKYADTMLPFPVLEYINGGVADDITLKKNTSQFESIHIYNRVLNDFSSPSTQCTLFSGSHQKTLSHPILLAPVAHQSLVHPEAELASAQAAHALNTPMIVSTLASKTLEDIAQHSNDLWFQLYWQPSRKDNLALLNRAINASYGAIVITLDAPVSGLRNRAQRAGFVLPKKININLSPEMLFPQTNAHANDQLGAQTQSPENTAKVLNSNDSIVLDGFMSDAPTLDDLIWLRQQTHLPLIAKGISHPDDALRLKEIGFDGIVVSNHGGRQLDGAMSSISALPAILDAVGDKIEVHMDGGIRSGQDVLKAVAMGAKGTYIGRSAIYGLGAMGEEGVTTALNVIHKELDITMALCGKRDVNDLDRDILLIPKDFGGNWV